MVPYNFPKLFPHLVCQPLWFKAALNQLLGTYRKLQQCHTCPNSAPTRGGGNTNRHTPAQGWQHLDAVVTLAITKTIHTESLASCQSYMVVIATHQHSQKRDERKNTCTQAHVHRGRGNGQHGQDWAKGSLILGTWRATALCAGPIHSPTSCLGPGWPSSSKPILILRYGPKKHQCNLLGTEKWVLLWSLNLLFKISYTFGLSIKIFSSKY
jgi:hypothetical protein